MYVLAVKGVVLTFILLLSTLKLPASVPPIVYINGCVPPSVDKLATTASAWTLASPSLKLGVTWAFTLVTRGKASATDIVNSLTSSFSSASLAIIVTL